MRLPYFSHHDAAERDERRRGEAELVGAEQRRNNHVKARAQLTVGLHYHTRPQVVKHERLVRLGDAELPRKTGTLYSCPATR